MSLLYYMENKNYLTITAIIFSIIFVLHVMRILLGWEAQIGGWMIPLWFSWIGILVSGYLAFAGFKMTKK